MREDLQEKLSICGGGENPQRLRWVYKKYNLQSYSGNPSDSQRIVISKLEENKLLSDRYENGEISFLEVLYDKY